MRRRRRTCLIAAFLTLIALAGAASYHYVINSPHGLPRESGDRAAFNSWLAETPDRRDRLRRFDAMLRREGVSGIIPTWTLLRADGHSSGRCKADAFVMPPPALWPHIVDTLKLVRSQVIPAVGRVAVVSAYRPPSLNGCAGGARQSRHMQFQALDLIPLDQPDAETSFRRLCGRWRRAGSKSRWGLGAYHDGTLLSVRHHGRFHVDATGWRTWGYSKHADSSACNQL